MAEFIFSNSSHLYLALRSRSSPAFWISLHRDPNNLVNSWESLTVKLRFGKPDFPERGYLKGNFHMTGLDGGPYCRWIFFAVYAMDGLGSQRTLRSSEQVARSRFLARRQSKFRAWEHRCKSNPIHLEQKIIILL